MTNLQKGVSNAHDSYAMRAKCANAVATGARGHTIEVLKGVFQTCRGGASALVSGGLTGKFPGPRNVGVVLLNSAVLEAMAEKPFAKRRREFALALVPLPVIRSNGSNI